MILSTQQKGDLNVYATSFLWALFPIITVLSYSTLDPLPSLAFSTLFAAAFFAVMVTIRGRWSELANFSALISIAYVVLFIGVGYYSFTFMALKYTTAGNVSLVGLLEIFFSYLFFTIWKKERFSLRHVFGSLLMIIGTAIVLLPNVTNINLGDLFAVISVMCAPIGNYFQQKARLLVSSETIMLVRSLLTVPIVFLISVLLGQHFLLSQVRGSVLFLLINGVLLLGFSKVLWIESIHRISVTRANALSSISPVLTLFFAYILLGQVPTIFQLTSIVPLIVGLLLLTRT